MPHSRFLHPVVALLVFVLLSHAAQAKNLKPLHMSNHAPLTAIFATPLSSSATLLGKGQSEWGIQVDSASVYSRRLNSQESFIQDGEFTTALFHYHMNLQTNWQLGVYLPWRYQSGGFSDSIVDGWHALFNLPEGGRDTAPKHRLLLSYQHQGRTELLVQNIDSGFMDMRTRLAYQLKNQANLKASLSGELKLKHADSKTLLGSGGMALSLFTDINWFSNSSLEYQARLGIQYRQRGDVLSQRQKSLLGFANLGLNLQLSNHWYGQCQLELSSAQYDSDLSELGASAQISLGLSYLHRKGQWDIAFSEDIAVSTAPDVAIHLSWRKTFK